MDLSVLNPEQRLAAETLKGPVLILAGAGSGKTRALTYRIANLLVNGVKPYQILALTFTNKAAREMCDRVEALMGSGAKDAWISTFHSTCARILRKDIDKIGYTSAFAIYDDDDQASIVRDIMRRQNIDDKWISVSEIKSAVSDMKNKLLNADEWFLTTDKDFRSQKVHDVITEYESRLKASNALDFDDLINKTLELFADHPPVLKYYQDRFEYVLVDEYQDTNIGQYMLVKLITRHHHNLCVVGDDDQSIYGWRGADIRNILNFEKDYPEAVVIRLERNYRSTGNILTAANSVIAHNMGRKTKTLWTEEHDGDPIRLFYAGDEREEAAWVCDQIRQLNKAGTPYSHVAILYRLNAQSRVLEEMLMRAGIPYRVFGGLRFYDRKEVRDIIAYLRVVVNPRDDVSLKRIINEPKRAIGDATIGELAEHAARHGLPLFDTLFDLPESLASRPRRCVTEFANMMKGLLDDRHHMSISAFVSFVMDRTGLMTRYQSEDSEENRSKVENLLEFLASVTEFEHAFPEAELDAFLENVALVTDLDRAVDTSETVTLMTLHSAKGLEFPAVFITGLEEGIFPTVRSMADDHKLEEERRLCYVGITRAMKRLYLCHAGKRLLYNQLSQNAPSRFLQEIPTLLLKDEMGAQHFSFTPREQPHLSANKHFDTAKNAQMGVPQSSKKDSLSPLGITGVQKGFTQSKAREFSTNIMQNLFAIDDRVLHKKFGEGNVTLVTGKGSDARIRISFTAYGEKEFLLSIAPIVKIGE